MEVAIAYSTGKTFVRYLCVSLTSLLRHISPENTYRIIVLNDDISDESKDLIRSTGYGYNNVIFEFVNASKEIPRNLYVSFGNIATYYRFALLDLFPEIDKILYLDADTIILTDVAELFKTDITGYYFAGVRDLVLTYWYKSGFGEYKEYWDDVLKLNNPLDYVNAGVLLFNLAELRKTYNSKKLIDMSAEHNYWFCDQDLLNLIAQGKIYILDFKWNFFGCVGPNEFATEDDKNQYTEASKNIAIIHYVMKKPWETITREYGKYFWKYAIDSVIADDIWNDFGKYIDNQINDLWLNEVRVFDATYAGKVGLKFYLRLAKATFIGNYRKLKRKFGRKK